MKAGEDNPQAREEEGKLYLLSTERNTYPAGIPGMWGSEFYGKATTFTLTWQRNYLRPLGEVVLHHQHIDMTHFVLG